ncbi:MAG: hypothetical protein H6932_16005 [Burkholderiaceae bacterium]|nr:hypothetical protein [Burkholderiaceae bacterium]
MNATRIVGIVLLVAGALALVYGGFSYTQEETAAKVGPLELKVEQQERVNIPLWAGIAAVLGGGVLVLLPGRR